MEEASNSLAKILLIDLEQQTIAGRHCKNIRIQLEIDPVFGKAENIIAKIQILKEPLFEVMLLGIFLRFDTFIKTSLDHYARWSNQSILALVYLLLVKCNWLTIEILNLSTDKHLTFQQEKSLTQHINLLLSSLPDRSQCARLLEMSFVRNRLPYMHPIRIPLFGWFKPSSFRSGMYILPGQLQEAETLNAFDSFKDFTFTIPPVRIYEEFQDVIENIFECPADQFRSLTFVSDDSIDCAFEPEYVDDLVDHLLRILDSLSEEKKQKLSNFTSFGLCGLPMVSNLSVLFGIFKRLESLQVTVYYDVEKLRSAEYQVRLNALGKACKTRGISLILEMSHRVFSPQELEWKDSIWKGWGMPSRRRIPNQNRESTVNIQLGLLQLLVSSLNDCVHKMILSVGGIPVVLTEAMAKSIITLLKDNVTLKEVEIRMTIIDENLRQLQRCTDCIPTPKQKAQAEEEVKRFNRYVNQHFASAGPSMAGKRISFSCMCDEVYYNTYQKQSGRPAYVCAEESLQGISKRKLLSRDELSGETQSIVNQLSPSLDLCLPEIICLAEIKDAHCKLKDCPCFLHYGHSCDDAEFQENL